MLRRPCSVEHRQHAPGQRDPKHLVEDQVDHERRDDGDARLLPEALERPTGGEERLGKPGEIRSALLLLRERGSGSRRVVERALKKAGLPLRSLRVAMELDSTEAIISGVEAELGVGFVSRCAVSKVLRLGSVGTNIS